MRSNFNLSPSLYVFENDLRLNDNQLFNQACAQAVADNTGLLCVYCFQPWQFNSAWLQGAAVGSARYAFIWQSLADLRQRLKDKGLSLVVRLGLTEYVVGVLQDAHQFGHIYHSQSAGYYEQYQWQQLATQWPKVVFRTLHTGCLFEPDDLPFEITDLPNHFTPFRKEVESLILQQPWSLTLCYPKHKFNELDQWAQLPSAVTDETVDQIFTGGELATQLHLADYFASQAPSSYKQVRNQLMGWSNSTKFSPWLALGCVSPRQIMQQLRDYEVEQGANESTYWIYFELLWREFFYWNALKQGAQLFQSKHNLEAAEQSLNHSESFNQWSQGQTGESLIDACMRELNQTGYLSNRGRQIVASYLIHELAVDWRLGASYFERMLIDYDVASNWGNWQYIAGVGADPRGGRHFNLKKQQQTHDPKQHYIQMWSEYETTSSTIHWDDLLV